ncbi:NRDE family protein [Novosphingobium sp. ZN18A2]|uniref:NRDE family protein n=1 Tax=Novosphingobium sp. ZN18A2 TaxID=3079861 RepID=UPI0030D4630F
MCVAALAWRAHPRWRLVVIANRDEFHARPAAPLGRWNDSGIIAGRDLEAGGTWLGVSEAGRFALVTNFRVPGYPKPSMASRGGLVTDWLLDAPRPDTDRMNPFHLLGIDPDGARHLTNAPAPAESALAPGIHGVSNGVFDRPWAKTRRLSETLGLWLDSDDDDTGALFAALADETPLPPEPDSEGPDLPFSPVFIRDPAYGTRCSTVVTIDNAGNGRIAERRFDPDGEPSGESRIAFRWPA